MTDATMTDVCVSKTPKTRAVSHFMKVSVAVEVLRAQHGAENARKIALQEQQKARRARSPSRQLLDRRDDSDCGRISATSVR